MLTDKIEERIKARYGIDVIADEIPVKKNNGVVEQGIMIKREGSMIIPMIYPNDISDGLGEEDVVERIAEAYMNQMNKDNINGLESFMDDLNAETIYSHVIPTVVGSDNADDLDHQDIYHEPYLDMEVVYRVEVDDLLMGEGFASFKLNNSIIESLEIDINILKERAMENLRKSARVDSIASIINERVPEFMQIPDDGSFPMYVATANNMYYGASVIMSEEVLSEIHDITGADSVYILPSSVNEIIAIPSSMGEDMSIEELRQFVATVNGECLTETDRLTENVYIHSRDGRMEVA